jgi:hypothetical protein
MYPVGVWAPGHTMLRERPAGLMPKKLADRCRLRCTKNSRFLHRLSGTELHSNFNAYHASFRRGVFDTAASPIFHVTTESGQSFVEIIAEFAQIGGQHEHEPAK